MSKSRFNYYSSGTGSGKPSPFAKTTPNKKPSWRSRFFDWLLFIAIVVCLTYSLLIHGPAKVASFSWPYRPAAVYQAAATKSLSGFKDKTKLSFDENGLSKSMTAQFPEIADIVVELPLVSQQPIVHLAISPPQFMLSSNSKTYILDADGVVVGTAANFSQIKNLPSLSDQSGLSVQPGQRLLSSDEVGFINQVLAGAKRAKVNVASAILPARGQELDIKTSDQPYTVKFYLGGNATQQVGQFLAARHRFASSKDQPKEYLDVRINGKIYYK